MLKTISPLISPDLLRALAQMGHGDEIVLADAHFPAYAFNQMVLRADGIAVDALLEAILPLFELDHYAAPVTMMAAVAGDSADPNIEARYHATIAPYFPSLSIDKIERFAFYERTKAAFCVLMTGETAKYGNIILKKGVQPINASKNTPSPAQY